MAQIRVRTLQPNTGDKIAVPNGRAVTAMIYPGPDPAKPRRASVVEAWVNEVMIGSVSVIDDDTNESLAPQTLTVFVPRNADLAELRVRGQKPGKLIVSEIPLDD